MPNKPDRRKAWKLTPGQEDRVPEVDLPLPPPTGPSRVQRLGRVTKTLLVVGLIVGGAWAAWRYGRPQYAKLRINPEVESAALVFAHELPDSSSSAVELQSAATALAADKLKSHLARNARWHVAYGRKGDDLTVLRDDLFTPSERAFVVRAIDEARVASDAAGTDYEVLEFPLGAMVRTVSVGGKPWYVAAVWCE